MNINIILICFFKWLSRLNIFMCLLTTLYLHLKSVLFIWPSLIGLFFLLHLCVSFKCSGHYSLIRNSSTQKIRNFPTLWGVSLLNHFCYCTQGFSFLYFFFLILFIAWARRILFRKSFLYLYFKFCPLYSEVQTKKKYSIKQKEKNPN